MQPVRGASFPSGIVHQCCDLDDARGPHVSGVMSDAWLPRGSGSVRHISGPRAPSQRITCSSQSMDYGLGDHPVGECEGMSLGGERGRVAIRVNYGPWDVEMAS